jgi:hypothetical protein
MGRDLSKQRRVIVNGLARGSDHQRIADRFSRAAGDGIWASSFLEQRGTQQREVSSHRTHGIKQEAKLVTNAGGVIEELPSPVRAVLLPAEAVGNEQRNL